MLGTWQGRSVSRFSLSKSSGRSSAELVWPACLENLVLRIFGSLSSSPSGAPVHSERLGH